MRTLLPPRRSDRPAAARASCNRWRCRARATGWPSRPGCWPAVYVAQRQTERQRRIRRAARAKARTGRLRRWRRRNWWIPSGGSFYSPDSDGHAAQELAYARQHFFLPHRYRDPFHTDAVSTESVVTYDAHDLLMVETRDPLGNRVTVGERDADRQPRPHQATTTACSSPRLITDPNRNRTEVAFEHSAWWSARR